MQEGRLGILHCQGWEGDEVKGQWLRSWQSPPELQDEVVQVGG